MGKQLIIYFLIAVELIVGLIICVVVPGALLYGFYLVVRKAWHGLGAAARMLFMMYFLGALVFGGLGIGSIVTSIAASTGVFDSRGRGEPVDNAFLIAFTVVLFCCALSGVLVYGVSRIIHKGRADPGFLNVVWMTALIILGLFMAGGSLWMMVMSLLRQNSPVFYVVGCVALGFTLWLFYVANWLLDESLAPFKGERRAKGEPAFLPDLGPYAVRVSDRLESRLKGHASHEIAVERRQVRLGLQRRTCLVVRFGSACALIRSGAVGQDLCLRSVTYSRGRHGFWSFVIACFEALSAPFVLIVGQRLSDKVRKPLDEMEAEDAKMLAGWVRHAIEAEAEQLRAAGRPPAARRDLGRPDEGIAGIAPRRGGVIGTLISFANSARRERELAGLAVKTIGLLLLVCLVVGLLVSPTGTGRIYVGVGALLGYVEPPVNWIVALWTRLPLALTAIACGSLLAAKMSKRLPSMPGQGSLGLSLAVMGAVFLSICGVWPVFFNLVLAACRGTNLAPGPLLMQFACYIFLGAGLLAAQVPRLRRGHSEPAEELTPGADLSRQIAALTRCTSLLRRYLVGSVLLVVGLFVWHLGKVGAMLVLVVTFTLLSFHSFRRLVRFLASLLPGERVAERPALLLADAAHQEAALTETVERELGQRELPYELKRITLSKGLTARSYLRVRLDKLAAYVRASSLGKDLCLVYYCQAGLGASLLERIIPKIPDPFEIEDVKMMCAALDNVVEVAADQHGIDRTDFRGFPGQKKGAVIHHLGFKKA